MPYIKPKKVWRKRFTAKQIDDIWDMFLSLCGKNVDWESVLYTEFFRNSYIPYPETDVWDDTIGIKPKQMEELLEKLDLNMIKKVLIALKEKAETNNYNRNEEYYEDGYLFWKDILNNELFPMLDDEDYLYNVAKFIVDNNRLKPENFNYYNYSKEIYIGILEDKIKFSEFNAILNKKPYPKSKRISLEEISMKDFWDNRKKIWKEELGLTPQSNELLMINPKYWHKDIFLESLNYHYKTKKFSDLKNEDQITFIKLYKVFGPHIKYLNSFIKERKYLINRNINFNHELYHLMHSPNNAFIKVIEESKKGIDTNIVLPDFEQFLITLSYFKDAKEDILKKDRIKVSDLKVLKEASTFIKKILSSGKEDSLKNMNYKTMSTLNKYNLSEQQKKWAMALFEKTCHLKTDVPLFEETIGEYTVEMIDKHDIRGLVAGNATNCCQTLNSAQRGNSYGGNACVYYGAEEKNSTFFLVSKNNRIIAQSWVWINKDQLTFDNIEILGNEVRESIVKAYEAYANFVINLPNSPIKRVTVGSGHSDIQLSKFWKEANNFKTINYAYDARSSQFEIAKK